MSLSRLFSLVLVALVAAAPSAQPDLRIVGSVEETDQGVEPGEDVSLDYTVFNDGTGEVEPTVGFYLSSDATLDSGDTLIGTDEAGNVGAGESEDDSEDVDIPSDTSDGEYFILFFVDYDGAIGETDESNNVDAAALTVGDGGGGGTGPDLVVSVSLAPGDDDDDNDGDSDLQPEPGESVDLDYTLSNVGDENSGSLTLRFYFSADTVVDGSDDVLLDVDNDGVDAGDNSDDTVTVTIPDGTAGGTYYILAEADTFNEVAEADETNNTASVEVEVTGGGGMAIGEVGTFNWPEQEPGRFYPIFLERAYTNPVVVAPSFSSEQPAVPAVPRVANVTADQFDIQLAEWPYQDGTHLDLDIPYLVVEAGTHTLEDGRRVEAGFVTTNGNGVARIDYSEAFPGRPVVFAQAIDSDAVVTARLRVREDRAQVRLVQQEAGGADLTPTTVAWVAFEQGVTGGERPASVKRVRVDDTVAATRYGTTVSTAAVILAATQSVAEDDPVVVRVRLSGRIGGRLTLQEEQSADAEQDHPEELVGYAVFEPGTMTASSARPVSARASAAPATAQREPAPLGVRPNPLASRAVVSFEVAEAGRVEVAVFDMTGRRVAVLSEGVRDTGRHEVAVDASGWPSGVYLVRLASEAGVETVPMTVVR